MGAKKNVLIKVTVLLLAMFTILSGTGPGYDPDAEIDLSIREAGGYKIYYNTKYYYIYFKDPDNVRKNLATYNWQKQYWIFKNKSFDPGKVDLASLFKKIDLSKTKLDRDKNEAEKQDTGRNSSTEKENKTVKKETTTSRTGKEEQSFSYDPAAKVDSSVRQMGPYLVNFNRSYPIILFRDANNPKVVKASYNWEKQYWINKNKSFDSSLVDLNKLFSSVDLTKTTLDREKPQSESVYADKEQENKPYDYSNDTDFADFMAYLQKVNTSREHIDFYLRAANSRAKRGAVQPHGTYDVNATGIKVSALKPVEYKNRQVPQERKKDQLIDVGGMQLYFELHKGDYLLSADTGFNIARDNKSIPVVIVELEPEERFTGNTMLRGEKLRQRVEKDLEDFLHKECTVSLVTMKLNYTGFGSYGKYPPLYHFDNYLAEHVNPHIKADSLIIYYFTDDKRLSKIDPQYSHPLRYGPYGTNWERLYKTIIHELGHSIGMHHHFSDRKGSNDINSHISPACVMNYRYKANEFCPLCRYALGIEE